MKNLFVSIAFLFPFVMMGSERINLSKMYQSRLLAPENVGVSFGKRGFAVEEEGNVYKCGPQDLDSNLRRVTKENIAQYLASGKIRVSRTSDGGYMLRSHIPGVGGGPITGALTYFGVKGILYIGAVTGIIAVAPIVPAVAPAVVPTVGAAVPGVVAGTMVTIELAAASASAAMTACPFLP